MHAVVIHETGSPDVLHYEETDRPEPGDGEVLIRVRAASVNPADWKARRGLIEMPLPAVLGYDVSGAVEVSRSATFAEGDEVFGRPASGGYAEFATASAAAITRKPAEVSHEQAAAIPVAGLTAWQALFDSGGLESGQTALIAGAAGGVGHLAVLGLGADEYVDYTEQDVGEAVSGVDVAVDTVGGETTESLVPTLREGGILVTIANAPPEEAARERGARAELLRASPSSEQLARIGELVAAGEVHVEITEVLPLTEVQRAQELSESGHTRGKIVLTVGS